MEVIDDIDLRLTLDELGLTKINRKREVVYGRQAAFKMLREAGYTLSRIGMMFKSNGKKGYLDHTTVIHGLNEYDLNCEYTDFIEIERNIHTELFRVLNPKQNPDSNVNEMIALTQMDALIGEML
tara:strand:- start:7708 stop:8082 length:375 start_codon:yes stop_codon:yes gene_type:complete